jgi:hypothetical protein
LVLPSALRKPSLPKDFESDEKSSIKPRRGRSAMNPVVARAGQRTELYRIRQGSIPIDFDFTVTPLQAQQSLAGYLEVSSSTWIFPGTPQRMVLQPRHQVRRGFWNTFFTLAIVPDVDVQIAPVASESSVRANGFIGIVALAVGVVVIAAVLMMWLTRP